MPAFDARRCSDQAPEEALCNGVDNLNDDVAALGEIDILADGTDSVRQQVGAITDDVVELRELAPHAGPTRLRRRVSNTGLVG